MFEQGYKEVEQGRRKLSFPWTNDLKYMKWKVIETPSTSDSFIDTNQ